MKHTSKKAPRRKYYRPSNDTKTFQINSKGHLQCLQDPNFIHRPNDKKEVFRLKIRLDLPHEMVKQIARLVKMNIFAPHHCGRKPFRLITA